MFFRAKDELSSWENRVVMWIPKSGHYAGCEERPQVRNLLSRISRRDHKCIWISQTGDVAHLWNDPRPPWWNSNGCPEEGIFDKARWQQEKLEEAVVYPQGGFIVLLWV